MATTRHRLATRTDELGPSAPLISYFGHHKCASTWLGDISREICAAAGIVYASVHSPRVFENDLRSFVDRNQIDFLAYVNANRTYVAALDDFRGFHVIRDPRDIVVSSYFSHLHSHPTTDWPELVDHRRQLQEVDKDRGLYVVIDFLEDVFDDIGTWDYADHRVLELKMEDVVRAPADVLVKAFSFLGLIDETRTGLPDQISAAMASVKRKSAALVPFRILPLPVSVVRATVQRNAFAVKAGGRATGVENVGSHYRKGLAGDWANHFGPGHKEYFKARYNDLLVGLGYESDLAW